jgi:hypothetical protein
MSFIHTVLSPLKGHHPPNPRFLGNLFASDRQCRAASMDRPPVVCDCGTGYLKMGIAGEWQRILLADKGVVCLDAYTALLWLR